jgi:hypothetical protein
MQIVDGTLEKALHLRSVEVDRDHVLNASNPQQVGKHASSNRTSMRLLLGLPAVREIRKDGCSTSNK